LRGGSAVGVGVRGAGCYPALRHIIEPSTIITWVASLFVGEFALNDKRKRARGNRIGDRTHRATGKAAVGIGHHPHGDIGAQLSFHGTCSNPLKLTDRSGQIIPVALCAIGGLSGAAGEFVGSGFQFNWKHSVIAFGVGCVSGVAAPLVATTTVGSVALGALGNIVQSIASQYFDDCDVNWKRFFWSGLSGAFGGYLGGTFKRPDFIHDTQYPYINNAVNYDNAVKTARSGFIRNFAGSVVGSIF